MTSSTSSSRFQVFGKGHRRRFLPRKCSGRLVEGFRVTSMSLSMARSAISVTSNRVPDDEYSLSSLSLDI